MTLVCNLYGGPGSGKSTTAAAVFSLLKQDGVNCELVREFAKELVWRGDEETLHCQPYVTMKQYARMAVLDGKVDVIVTDSPLLLGLIYRGRGSHDSFQPFLLDLYWEFQNLDYVLKRDPNLPYNPKGRLQNVIEAEQIDHQIGEMLSRLRIKSCWMRAGLAGNADWIASELKSRLTARNTHANTD